MDKSNRNSAIHKNWLLLIPLAGGLLIMAAVFLVRSETTTTARPDGLNANAVAPLGIPEKAKQPEPPTLAGALDYTGIRAKSFLAYDVKSGKVLAEREPEQPVAIASVTKLMTGLVVYRNMESFRKPLTITSKDLFSIEPVLGLVTGDKISVGDLFYAMLVGSANDAALALANHVEAEAGSSFVKMMNDTAQELGMANSHFSNPLGFDSEANYSTADDIRKLVEAVREHQGFNLVGRNKSYSFASASGNEYSVKATNKLIEAHKDLYAIKTGFTSLAQGAMITESRDNGNPFVIIILDSTARENDTLALRSQILKNYTWPDTEPTVANLGK